MVDRKLHARRQVAHEILCQQLLFCTRKAKYMLFAKNDQHTTHISWALYQRCNTIYQCVKSHVLIFPIEHFHTDLFAIWYFVNLYFAHDYLAHPT